MSNDSPTTRAIQREAARAAYLDAIRRFCRVIPDTDTRGYSGLTYTESEAATMAERAGQKVYPDPPPKYREVDYDGRRYRYVPASGFEFRTPVSAVWLVSGITPDDVRGLLSLVVQPTETTS